jgi:hypothetical protein
MRRDRISHSILMDESEQFVSDVARSGADAERLVAGRLLEDTRTWRTWESEHASLMRRVVEFRRSERQVGALRSVSLAMIHRKALFEYLREHHIVGEARRRLVLTFHGTTSYSHAMVAEHGNYLRSACSFFCSSHLGTVLWRDGTFQSPLDRYSALYAEYFDTYCDSTLQEGERATQARLLLPSLKRTVEEYRHIILALPRSAPSLFRESEFSRRTGDTIRVQRPS